MRIRAVLKAKRMTAESLAFDIDMSKGYLSNFLTGKKGMSLVTLRRISRGLKVKIRDLLPED
jgi:transcriptional regulator with XRE-family HTH domain